MNTDLSVYSVRVIDEVEHAFAYTRWLLKALDQPEDVYKRQEDGCLVLETHFEKFANINYKKSPSDWIKNTKFMPYTSG